MTGSTSQGTNKATGSVRVQTPFVATHTASLAGSQDTQSHMAQEIAAENQRLIASMQPDQANPDPAFAHESIPRTCQESTVLASATSVRLISCQSPKIDPCPRVQAFYWPGVAGEVHCVLVSLTWSDEDIAAPAEGPNGG